MRKGFLPDVYEKLEAFSQEKEYVEFGSVKEITDKFASCIDELI
jgi:hypothetical protein